MKRNGEVGGGPEASERESERGPEASERQGLLALPGAVAASWPDEGVAAHYGDPVREQRALDGAGGPGDAGIVDRSNRGVLKITGPDRLSWLNSLTTQRLDGLAAGESAQALVLSPTGHVEHHLTLSDDGTRRGYTSSRVPRRRWPRSWSPCGSCCGSRWRTSARTTPCSL